METMNLRRLVRLAASLSCLIFVVGLFVGGAQPVAVGLIPAPWDKLAHVAAFGTLATMVELALRPHTWLFFALPLAVSAADEFHQAFLPGRCASIEDWLAGALGVGLAWWILRQTRFRELIAALRG
jgi:VanZ family protein